MVKVFENRIRVRMLVFPGRGKSFEAMIPIKGKEEPTRVAGGSLAGLAETIAAMRIPEDVIFDFPLNVEQVLGFEEAFIKEKKRIQAARS